MLSLRSLILLFSCIVLPMATSRAAEEIYPLKKLLIADTEARVLAMSDATPSSIAVDGVAFLNQPDFAPAVAKFFGQPISSAVLNGLADAVAEYAKQHDRLIVKLLIPTQNVTNGSLRLVVLVGRYNDLEVRGNRWFSSKLLEEKLGVHPGDEIRISALDQAVNWANTNPFRQVKVLVNEVANQPGKADLIIGVRERIPVRFALSFDDAGNEILGERHYAGSIQFGNLWGLDHQGSIQYITTDHVKTYQAEAFDYKVPLPWRHFIQLSGTYVRARPVFGGGLFGQDAENISAALRYTIPLRNDDNPAEFFTGLEFKESNNNLEFGGIDVLNTKVDVFQASAGFTTVRRDKRGAWAFGATVYASPGNMNSRNNASTYESARAGSTPTYVYGNLSLQRSLTIAQGWDIFSRVVAQVSGSNLVANEQLTIGGANTARGFNTNVYAGDEGFVFCTDLQTPVLSTKLPFVTKTMPPLESRFALFYDAAQVFYKHRYGFDPKMTPLASAGIGIRTSLSNNFSLNFDYGWQITRLPYPVSEHGRGHIKVVLAY